MARPPQPRIWDGKGVHFAQRGLDGLFDNKDFRADLKEETARKLALTLSKYKQICNSEIEPELDELLSALNFVLVGDPASREAHRVMEVGKGMTPDGGHKAPEPRRSDWRDDEEFGPRYT